MRVAYISNMLPVPQYSGSAVRVYNLLKHLSNHFEMSFFCIDEFGSGKDKIPELEKFASPVKAVPFNKEKPSGVYARSILKAKPSLAEEFFYPELKKLVLDEHRQKPFDAVMVEHLPLCEYLKGWEKPLLILSLEDLNSFQYRRRAGVEPNLFKKMLYLFEAGRMKKYETRMGRMVDLVAAVSQDELELLKKRAPKTDYVLTRNGVDCERNSFSEKDPVDPSVALIGNLNYYPNVDAVEFFLDEIFPLVLKQEPAAMLTVAGITGKEHVRQICQRKNVRLVTDPEKCADLRPVVREASVSVVPLRIAGGTRLKIPEAFALGRPVVSTTIGAEGIEAENEKEFLIADSPAKFAECILRLFKNPGLYRALTKAARTKAEDTYDWKKIAWILANAIKKSVNKKN